jgi:hypothetical protein
LIWVGVSRAIIIKEDLARVGNESTTTRTRAMTTRMEDDGSW